MFSMRSRGRGFVGAALAAILLAASVAVRAEVVSETILYLQADGRSVLHQRSMRTDNRAYDFYVDKEIGLDDFLYISPNVYTWDDQAAADVNRLHFERGDFVVIYQDRLAEQVSVDADGVYTFASGDGATRDDGHFGIWNMPDDFARLAYTWVIPAHFQILDYASNRDGDWVLRNNTLAFFASDVNDVTFTIRYREVDSDEDGVGDRADRCPDSPAGSPVDGKGCELDADADGVVDRQDRCPATPEGAAVDAQGCELDADADGIVDRLDRCPATPSSASVDSQGCELDADEDGVTDTRDWCPDTPAGAQVSVNGCPIDCDEDGVPNGLDACPRSPADVSVDARGCEVDTDADGIVDSQDACPGTPAGRLVDMRGCEVDSDGDGVVDSEDLCAETPPGQAVNALGCAPDADDDAVIDARDLCPDTPAGVEVDAAGCAAEAPIALPGVGFAPDSAELTGASREVLDRVAQILSSVPGLRLEVAGHTDSAGPAEHNRALSQRRAEAVMAYLIERGIEPERLSARGYGEEQPLADNATAEGRASNRRVELRRRDGG